MGGIDCEFAETISKGIQFECPICLLVLREPYQATCCGKSFCKECIEPVKRNNQACPICSGAKFKLFHNKGLEQSLYDFEVYCSHKSKGCEWTGELRELDKHLNSEPPADKSLEGCPFTVINCPLSHTTGCELRLPRKDVKIHMNDDLLDHVMKQTALVLALKQSNETLSTQIQVINAELESVDAKLVGITEKLHSARVENRQLKLRLTELEGKVKQFDEAKPISELASPCIVPVTFTMTNFQQHNTDDDIWYSPPLYTHRQGYKMCLRVNANGDTTAKGTHVSVRVHIMRGEFDNQLKWPFRGDVTIQLLNQEEDKHHVEKVITFNDHTSGKSGNRVTDVKMNTSGQGSGRFLSHTDLQPKYLNNDCINFCILKVVLAQ